MGLLQWHFAAVFNGIVDFQGALLPRLPESMYENIWLWEKAHWADVEPYFNAMITTMPGKAVTVLYQPLSDRTWAYHVADTAFLNAWLAHPAFHMIK